MNYTEEYNTKDAMITLLQDFLSIITEEYEASEDIIQVLSSPINEVYINKIKSGLKLCCPQEIEEKFSQTIALVLSAELTDFSELDSIITELYRDIEKLSCNVESRIQEGVYQSPFEDLTIGTIWNSNTSSSISDSSNTICTKRHKLNSIAEEESEKIGKREVRTMYETIEKDNILNTTISELDLSVRAYNTLKRENINTLRDLTNLYEDDLYKLRYISKNTSEEIIKKVRSLGLSFKTICKNCSAFLSKEELESKSKLCKDCKELTEFSSEIDVNIKDIKLPVRTIRCLTRAGLYDFKKLLDTTFDEIKSIRNLSMHFAVDFLYKFDEAGYRIKDCKVEDYPTIDDFIKYNFNCSECDSYLNGTTENIKRILCTDCSARLKRTEEATTITLEVKKPEFQSYTGEENGFTIYININSHVSNPIKIKLQECSIYTDGRQRISNYHYTGYGFSEDYIFPQSTKTFAKIWITDKWDIKELSKGEDYITISFKDINSDKIFFFKFLYIDEFTDWKFYDYYELD